MELISISCIIILLFKIHRPRAHALTYCSLTKSAFLTRWGRLPICSPPPHPRVSFLSLLLPTLPFTGPPTSGRAGWWFFSPLSNLRPYVIPWTLLGIFHFNYLLTSSNQIFTLSQLVPPLPDTIVYYPTLLRSSINVHPSLHPLNHNPQLLSRPNQKHLQNILTQNEPFLPSSLPTFN